MSQRILSTSILLSRSLTTAPVARLGNTAMKQRAWRNYSKEATNKTSMTGQQSQAAVEGKFKQLARKYGPAGIIVYFGVGAIDLGVTFAAIQLVGSDKVKLLEKGVMDTYRETKERLGFKPASSQDNDSASTKKLDHVSDDDQPSLTSIFLLAYGIHKTLLLPVRLAITTAITPAVVRKVHAWGWAKYAPRLLGGTSTAISKS